MSRRDRYLFNRYRRSSIRRGPRRGICSLSRRYSIRNTCLGVEGPSASIYPLVSPLATQRWRSISLHLASICETVLCICTLLNLTMNMFNTISKAPFEAQMWSGHSSPQQAWSESASDTSSYEDVFRNDWDFTMDNTALLQSMTANVAYPDMPAMNLQMSNTSFDSTPSNLDVVDNYVNQTETATSQPQKTTNTHSRNDQRRERRRIQNRNSQRQYRARKETLLKDYSQRIAELENELRQYQSANADLTKVIQTLRKQEKSNGAMTQFPRLT